VQIRIRDGNTRYFSVYSNRTKGGATRSATDAAKQGRVVAMNENIRGKVIVITGASSGLGEVAARRLSAEGASVVLGARRADRLASLTKEFAAKDASRSSLRPM
jgi:NADPH:quinone reductase-like Zn-dependent oxidoreductase